MSFSVNQTSPEIYTLEPREDQNSVIFAPQKIGRSKSVNFGSLAQSLKILKEDKPRFQVIKIQGS